ncbi:hypothetical protein ACHAXM_000448 [Skeletonema potamos]
MDPARRSRSLQTTCDVSRLESLFGDGLDTFVKSVVDETFGSSGGVTTDPSSKASIDKCDVVACPPTMPPASQCLQVTVVVTLQLDGASPLTTRAIFETGISDGIERNELTQNLPSDSGIIVYSAASSAKVTGVVYLKLKGSRRHLAVDVEIAGRPKVKVLAAPAAGSTSTRALQIESVGDQKSAFTITVELAKNELGGEANGATNVMMSEFIIVVASVIGSAAAIMML